MPTPKLDYLTACHAMQAGVAYEQGGGSNDGTPKHLRVGVNTAMRDHASLVKLLIKKGLLTEEEYLEAITDGMNEEVDLYEARASIGGVKITFR